MSKRQPIKKKNFFYLFPLLTYSAMSKVWFSNIKVLTPKTRVMPSLMDRDNLDFVFLAMFISFKIFEQVSKRNPVEAHSPGGLQGGQEDRKAPPQPSEDKIDKLDSEGHSMRNDDSVNW